jgi:fructan beta-fructosidase
MNLKHSFPGVVIFLSILTVLICSCQSKQSFHEQDRPQYHFSPPESWMNDPNGLVYYNGEYHLFYQYYPDSTVWGPMHWGHSISKDLIHWEHLPVALFPDTLGYIFSGSAVIDWKNSAGMQSGKSPAMIAIFTQHSDEKLKMGRNDYQVQSMAYSNDKGRTFTKYALNPVIKNPGETDFRDPKVRWDEGFQKWIMVFAAGQKIKFYSSANLLNWEYMSEFGIGKGAHGGVWECPDLFPLKIMNEEKWVLLVSINPGGPNGGSSTQYFIGSFDGTKFTEDNPDSTTLWLDYGPDNYAGVTWSDIPPTDGRRIFIGWMSNWNYAQSVPTVKWRSSMTIPRELNLKNTNAGIRLVSTPVSELNNLRKDKSKPDLLHDLLLKISGLNELIIKVDLSKSSSDSFGLIFSNSKNESLIAGYDKQNDQFYIDRTGSGNNSFSKQFSGKHFAPRILRDNILEMRLFLDCTSLEMFADGGTVLMTGTFFPDENMNQVSFFQKNGITDIIDCELYNLSSIWK